MVTLLQVESSAREVTTTDSIVIVAAIITTFVAGHLIRPVIRAVLTWLARRSINGRGGRWRVRTPRVFGETAEQAELRRLQRIAATAAGLSRVLSAVLWAATVLVILDRAEIDLVFALGGAGFLGVAVAIGGQHSVNDFVTGMHILLEDRFGEGDKLRLQVGDELMTLTVMNLGAFATRLQDGEATIHIPNGAMTAVANLSQRGATTEFAFAPSTKIEASNPKAQVEASVRARYSNTRGFDGGQDGLVFDSIDEYDGAFTVRVRTARPLSKAQREALAGDEDETPLID